MAITSWCYLLLLVFSLANLANATVFTLQNLCSYTIWPGTLSGNGAATLGGGGFVLSPGSSIQLQAPPSWSGRFWARLVANLMIQGLPGRRIQHWLRCEGTGWPVIANTQVVRRILMGTAQQNYRWLIRVRLLPARVLVKRLMHRSFVAPATIRHRSLAHRPSTRRCSRMHARRPTVMLMMMQQVLALAPGRIT
ncbi:hypothetical protein GH714_014964 [Hevea brasiliensis]|uniref:Uncharacterized protein n=1 Tax=Hevea brasiliensis TaxID=3981 RepID=A0A6A6NH86_HEVBR|nr:hypothetical protein GH714_014964 [Hevea brasiliensis]